MLAMTPFGTSLRGGTTKQSVHITTSRPCERHQERGNLFAPLYSGLACPTKEVEAIYFSLDIKDLETEYPYG